MEQEIWKPIPGFEGVYEASSFGRIKTLKRVYTSGRNNSHVRVQEEKILKFRTDKDGYFRVKLMKDGSAYYRRVARIVCMTFHSNPDNLPIVNHKDGNKQNDHIDNLEWTTFSGNTQHAFDNGLIDVCRGEKHQWSKLTESQVEEIINLYKEHPNLSFKEVGNLYGVSGGAISKIVRGERWSEHYTPNPNIPKKSYKHHRVIHLETGEIHNSVTEAAKANGIQRDLLRNYLVGKRQKHQLPFDFYED